ncbi:MAG: transketolase family protein [Dehalococcoidia bacterium]|nr:transketolase family protein [Dehalococcoidia bacterium]
MAKAIMAAPRDAYGKTLVELGKENRDIVVLDADLSKSTRTIFFAREFPERFFDCGIAEQNMIGIASGLAASGKTAFTSSFAVFTPGRCFDQIRISAALPHLNIKVVATHGGISVGEDGASHQAIEDFALACAIPGMRVIVPTDAVETAQVIREAANIGGPFYIRLPRSSVPLIHSDSYHFELGKSAPLREGKDITIIAAGVMVSAALQAAAELEKDGVDCRVLSMPTLKPIDEGAIIKAARETGAIVTAEEHSKFGGLGSIVSQAVTKNSPVPMSMIAINDIFAESGKPAQLLQKYGLTAVDIKREVISTISRK